MTEETTSTFEFEPWPKIARLNRDITITEKIDGTNAAIIFEPFPDAGGRFDICTVETETGRFNVGAQSRKRLILPGDDNFGFARWVADNAEPLFSVLGPGRHFGEWWGSGVQRGYGLPQGERRFSLFNTARYAGVNDLVDGLSTVPVLYQGPFSEDAIQHELKMLAQLGSIAALGFTDPEGIIVFHSAANMMFKVTIKGDEAPKSTKR